MKAIKKPTEINFIQLGEDNIREVYKFVHGAYPTLESEISREKWSDYERIVKKKGMELKTLESGEGTQIASMGDIIIEGVEGEKYPCKPDIFDKTYIHEYIIGEEGMKDELMCLEAYKAMCQKMKSSRKIGHYGWWDEKVLTTDDLRGLFERAVEDCDYASVLNFTAMLMVRDVQS